MLYLSNIDLNKNQLQNAQVHPLGSPPAAPVEGQIYFDSSVGDKKLYYYNGTGWIATGAVDTNNYVTGGSIASGTVTLTRQGLASVTFAINNNQITNGAGYITSASLPTVGDGTLTVQGTGVLGGTGTFTANQSGNTTISVTHDALGTAGTYAYPSSVTTNSTGHVTAITAGSAPTTPSDATITLAAGTGLTTGGAFTLDQAGDETITFNIGSGDGITVNANDVAVDVDDDTIQIVSGEVAAKTAAVANGGTALATGDQIYDFVTGTNC